MDSLTPIDFPTPDSPTIYIPLLPIVWTPFKSFSKANLKFDVNLSINNNDSGHSITSFLKSTLPSLSYSYITRSHISFLDLDYILG